MRLIYIYILTVLFTFSLFNNLYSQNLNLDPEKQITQYRYKSWSLDEGLETNSISDIVQAPDGYIWIASYDGLTRFDGLIFKKYTSQNTEALHSHSIEVLATDHTGSIWIGSQKGIALCSNNIIYRKNSLEKLDNFYIVSFFSDRDNNMWISTNANGLYLYKEDSLYYFNEFYQKYKTTVLSITEDKSGTIWLGTSRGELFKYNNDEFISCAKVDDSNGFQSIYIDKNEQIWIGGGKSIYNYKNGQIKAFKYDIPYATHIIQDFNNLYWISSYGKGLIRYDSDSMSFDSLNIQNGLDENNVMKFIIDQQGNLFSITYRSGLFQLNDGSFTCYSKTEGLASNITTAVMQFSDSVFWIGTDAGIINVIENGKINELKLKTNLSAQIKCLFKDSKNNVWISTYKGLIKKTGNKEVYYSKQTGFPGELIRLTYEDSKGNIWIGTNRTGLHKLSVNGNLQSFDTKNGMSSDFIMSIAENEKGELLVGTKNGLNQLKNDSIIKKFYIEDGLPDNFCFKIRTGSDNTFWIATNEGISRFKDGIFKNINVKNGLYTNNAFDILADDYGYFWIPCNKGIMRISEKQLNDFCDGSESKVDYILYDKSYGMKSSICIGATQYLKDNVGNIWFNTTKGVAKLDPKSTLLQFEMPRLYFEELRTDTVIQITNNNLEISPGIKRFQISYTAIDNIAPEKILFRYKLYPFEEEWVYAETDRNVTYTNIPPGEYVFNLSSTNTNGTWNSESINVKLNILAAWWQTILFKIFSAVSIIALIVLSYFLRVRQIERRNKYLEMIVNQRTQEIKKQNKEIEIKNQTLENQKLEILKQNEKITDSINYANRIQESVFISDYEIRQYFPESFLINKPKDIVSGDFFWICELENIKVFSVVDCTGHGVPGAFMSLIGNSILSEIVKEKKIVDPGTILNHLHNGVLEVLRQEAKYSKADDGMEMFICVIEDKNEGLKYSAAGNFAYLIRDKEILMLKGNDFSIGDTSKLRYGKLYETKNIKLKKDSQIYLMSDGYTDQFGGPGNKKYNLSRFEKKLLSIHQLPMFEQRTILNNEFETWKGKQYQIDDVMVLGIKFSNNLSST